MTNANSKITDNKDFVKFWSAQSISMFGSVVTRDTLPVLAVLVLSADSVGVSLVMSVMSVAPLFIGFVAGVWVDRLRIKRILIFCDLARAALLVSIPCFYVSGYLTLELLIVEAFLLAATTAVAKISDQSLLPILVRQDQLIDGNSKLGISEAVSEVGGASLAGVLITIFTAPFALIADALSYLVSAGLLSKIKTDEVSKTEEKPVSGFWEEFKAGFDAVLESISLKQLLTINSVMALFGGMIGALYVLYVLTDVGVSPLLLGLLTAVGGAGAIGGAILSSHVSKYADFPVIVFVCILIGAFGILLIATVSGSYALMFAALFIQQLVGDTAITVMSIQMITKQQAQTPNELLGRVSSIFIVLPSTSNVVGLLIGGAFGAIIGLRETLTIASLGFILLAVFVYIFMVRKT